MRHTLLPLHERIVLRREYYVRVLIVFCFMLSVAILVGVVAIFPTYVRALAIEKEAKATAVSVANKTENLELKEIQQSVAQSLALLGSLNSVDDSAKISELISGVINIRGSIRFNTFAATKLSTSTFTMSIQGFAPTRAALLAFKNKFESISPDNKIDLPVSELAKSANIQFSLQLKEKVQ